MSAVPATRLDARGLSCPLPVVKARLAIDKLASGELLEVLATDPGSVSDFENWAKMTGHALVESSSTDGEFRYLIRKS